MLGRLEKYKVGRDAAALHAHKLQEELTRSRDQAKKWKASCTELSNKSSAQVLPPLILNIPQHCLKCAEHKPKSFKPEI